MAGFNWFRRSFDRSESPDTEAKPTDPTPPVPTVAKVQGTAPVPAQLSPEDYLKWAKAAYQNIQNQHTETAEALAETEPAPESASEELAAEPEAGVAAESVVVEPAPEVPSPEPPSTEADLDLENTSLTLGDDTHPAAVDLPESAPVEPVGEFAATPEASREEAGPAMAEGLDNHRGAFPAAPAPETVESSPSAPLPFWARAEDERQQRLERLRETAIVEPEPEPAVEPIAPPLELSMPDLALDEAFLWSAEVLAAQGRRPDDISVEEITWLNRLRQGLNKTRLNLVNQLKAIVGQGPLNDDAVMEIEALLLQADVGVAATDKVIEALQDRMRQDVLPPDQAIAYLKAILRDMLDAPLGESHNLTFVPEKDTLNIWLMTGVNGAGKTTTIGKLAHIAKKSGYNTLIAAADTFRAAAVEQVKAWGARSEVEVIANPGKNTDPAAVVYDAIAAAQARKVELLLVDTAGRLQNKKNLMDELAKIRRIVDKNAPEAKIEALLVLDATLGQNGLRQAEVFAEAANLSGVVLTKLDGTAKGGVALAVVEQLGLPIRFIGAGEGIEDLRPFSSYEFVEALLSG
ncbi:MAG TPA: signal recognition particle-docking protein FtsY [Leptolyngbyaceae cyanobacterium M65_K2018_010]|nr:signal recognition particle-docking protein FtsY [Leptolyngbyaceae cyanobacterium M65_K2018_010]